MFPIHRHHHPLLCIALLCAAALGGCTPRVVPNTPARGGPVVDLWLTHADGTGFRLSAQHASRPTLLFLFATYDTASQLALAHLERFLADKPEIDALGLALQPDAPAFLGIYRDALGIDFPLAYDAQGVVLTGKSDLGAIDAVPAFVVLDGGRRLRAVRYGVATELQLHELIEAALAQ